MVSWERDFELGLGLGLVIQEAVAGEIGTSDWITDSLRLRRERLSQEGGKRG